MLLLHQVAQRAEIVIPAVPMLFQPFEIPLLKPGSGGLQLKPVIGQEFVLLHVQRTALTGPGIVDLGLLEEMRQDRHRALLAGRGQNIGFDRLDCMAERSCNPEETDRDPGACHGAYPLDSDTMAASEHIISGRETSASTIFADVEKPPHLRGTTNILEPWVIQAIDCTD
ncbi:hypothetical protein KUL25_21620 [Rhodobacteraceae bacterium N5(2021)]|uniref:Uncharacterized protein n=1 Tax=Gymnodinialimonas phycosphaerae TaxID=2841589 RepID=A0A975YI25_9RHOB|nr:hypothetical protein [Gymnodinialimonas phycosphaerae]MBY4895369.1 hypothetical protein [Gymnodinialimonas phycosphaerae]